MTNLSKTGFLVLADKTFLSYRSRLQFVHDKDNFARLVAEHKGEQLWESAREQTTRLNRSALRSA